MRTRLIPAIALLAVSWCGLPADEIVLQDGRTLEGDLLTPDDAPSIEIRVTQGGMVAIERFQREEVVSIHHGQTAHQLAMAAFAATKARLAEGGTAAEWLALAHQAQALHDRAAVRECAQEAEVRDRYDLEAHHLLEEVLINGIWMLPREAAVAQGQVFYDGQWMPWSERQQRIAAAQAAAAAAAAERTRLVEHARGDDAPPPPDGVIPPPPPAIDPGYLQGGYYGGYYGPVIYGPGVIIGNGWNTRCGGGVVGWGGVVIGGGSFGGNGRWGIHFHW